MTKEALVKVVNDLPNEFELDELMEKLVVLAKIEKGRQQFKDGKTLPHDEVVKIIKSWSK
jgi:hypothetical protein